MPQTECKGHGEPTGRHGGPGPDLSSFKTVAVSQTLYLGLGEDMDSIERLRIFQKHLQVHWLIRTTTQSHLTSLPECWCVKTTRKKRSDKAVRALKTQ